MNTIQFSPVSYKGLNPAKSNTAAQKAKADDTAQNQSETKLPGYNLSFGMARIVRKDNATNLQYKDVEFIDNCFNKNTLSRSSYESISQDDAKEAMDSILDKYSDNDKAIGYTITKALKQGDKRAEDLLDALIDTIKTKYKEEDPDKAEKLMNMVLDTKTPEGKDFLSIVISNCTSDNRRTSLGTLSHKLSQTEDFPNLQYKILMAKTEDDRSFLAPHGTLYAAQSPSNDTSSFFDDMHKTDINKTIHTLTAESEEITVEDSIALLETYESILDGYNKEILDILTTNSDDYNVFDRPKDPRIPGASAEADELIQGGRALPGEVVPAIESGNNQLKGLPEGKRQGLPVGDSF